MAFDELNTCLDLSMHCVQPNSCRESKARKWEGTTVCTTAPSVKSRLSLIGEVEHLVKERPEPIERSVILPLDSNSTTKRLASMHYIVLDQ